MTKADLYKRRSKNKQRNSGSSEPSTSAPPPRHDSIDNDLELIKANTIDTPDQPFEDDDIPAVKPVEKTYSKSRSKLDDYIYIESSQGLDETEVAFPKTTRGKKKEPQSPIPRKRRKIDTKTKKPEINGERELRSKTVATEATERVLRSKSGSEKEKRPAKESIENEKTVVTRVTRKRKYEETSKPVLREKGQNGHSSRKNSLEVGTRKIAKAKKTKPTLPPLKLDVEQNVRMTRSRRRRLEISLSPSQVKSIAPAFSFESDRRVDSMESTKSAKSNTKAKTTRNTKAKNASKAKKTPVRSVRTRATRR